MGGFSEFAEILYPVGGGREVYPQAVSELWVSDVFEGRISEEGKLFAIQTDLDEIVFYVSDDLPGGEDHEP